MREVTTEAGWQALLAPRLVLTLCVLLGGVLLHSMNVLITATLLPSIVAELGGANLMSWPTTAFVATTSLVTSFQAFDVVRIMTQGGPAQATQLFVYAIYEQIFLDLSVGRASALTVVFFALLLAVASLQLAAWRSRTRGRA